MRKYEYPYVCIPICKCTSVCVHEWNGREVWAIAHCYNTNIILNMPNSHPTVLNIESNLKFLRISLDGSCVNFCAR